MHGEQRDKHAGRRDQAQERRPAPGRERQGEQDEHTRPGRRRQLAHRAQPEPEAEGQDQAHLPPQWPGSQVGEKQRDARPREEQACGREPAVPGGSQEEQVLA
jgi:hypothetical protein